MDSGPALRASRNDSQLNGLWLRQDKPGHDGNKNSLRLYLFPGSEITRLATSLFQMNSTTSAPIVAVMKPAPWFGP
jgi:hypothetical protein